MLLLLVSVSQVPIAETFLADLGRAYARVHRLAHERNSMALARISCSGMSRTAAVQTVRCLEVRPVSRRPHIVNVDGLRMLAQGAAHISGSSHVRLVSGWKH